MQRFHSIIDFIYFCLKPKINFIQKICALWNFGALLQQKKKSIYFHEPISYLFNNLFESPLWICFSNPKNKSKSLTKFTNMNSSSIELQPVFCFSVWRCSRSAARNTFTSVLVNLMAIFIVLFFSVSDWNDPQRAVPRPEGPACGGRAAEQQRRPVRHCGLELNPETVPDHTLNNPAGQNSWTNAVHDSNSSALMEETSSESGYAGSLEHETLGRLRLILFFSLFF